MSIPTRKFPLLTGGSKRGRRGLLKVNQQAMLDLRNWPSLSPETAFLATVIFRSAEKTPSADVDGASEALQAPELNGHGHLSRPGQARYRTSHGRSGQWPRRDQSPRNR